MQLAYNMIALVVVVAGWGGVLIAAVLYKIGKLMARISDVRAELMRIDQILSVVSNDVRDIRDHIKKLNDSKAPANGKGKVSKKV